MNRILAAAIGAAALAGCQGGGRQPGVPGTPAASTLARGATACAAPALLEYGALKDNPKLPDPFTFAGGRKIASKADWACRRAELKAQIQHYELGEKPGTAPVQARMLEKELVVDVSHAGKTISFPVKVQLPPNGRAPYPAIIGMGMATLNNEELARMGIALVTFPNNAIAEQQNGASRGKGKFYELYGKEHTASAMTAWAWGVSRLIDALERTPEAQVDPTRLGVTGCSRNGKGAIVAGAFDERIRLTIAQESGSGGAAGWRISDAQLAAGQNVQTLRQIVTENVWFTESFRQFGPSPGRLPFDQHSVMALIAPRGLLVVENSSMEWLGNQSAYLTSVAALEVWKALGAPDAMGISQVGGHPHCKLPASQYRIVGNYARKFLLDDAAADTRVRETDGGFSQDLKPWVDWSTPVLR